jgi:Spy/CpxP family protein refolding chaperone
MSKMVAAPKVDERATLAQADRVMALEKDIKQLHLRTLIRLKNSLTDKQRALLDKKRGRGGVRGPR